jgi:hypothetical protein
VRATDEKYGKKKTLEHLTHSPIADGGPAYKGMLFIHKEMSCHSDPAVRSQ